MRDNLKHAVLVEIPAKGALFRALNPHPVVLAPSPVGAL